MSKVLEGRVAVITGSGEGIGRATALRLAQEGAKVVVNDIMAANADKTAAQIKDQGGQALAFAGDISNFETAEKLMKAAADNFGKIDILHNNAGIVRRCNIWEFTEKDWDSVINVNLKGSFNCIRHAAPYMMKQKWGRIINVSSGARLGMPGNTSYAAAKAGVLGLTANAALELVPHGITCNAYQPTAATQFTLAPEIRAGFDEGYKHGEIPKDLYEVLINPPPPESIAPLVMYLCTDDAANVNGKLFNILGDAISILADSAIKCTIFNKGGWAVEDLKKAAKVLLT